MDPAAMRIRRAVAAGVVIAVAIGFVLLFRFVLRVFAMPAAPVGVSSRKRMLWPVVLLLLPAALIQS